MHAVWIITVIVNMSQILNCFENWKRNKSTNTSSLKTKEVERWLPAVWKYIFWCSNLINLAEQLKICSKWNEMTIRINITAFSEVAVFAGKLKQYDSATSFIHTQLATTWSKILALARATWGWWWQQGEQNTFGKDKGGFHSWTMAVRNGAYCDSSCISCEPLTEYL